MVLRHMRWILHDAVLKDRLPEALSILSDRGDEAVVITGRRPDLPQAGGPTIGLVSVQVARAMFNQAQRFRPGVFWHPSSYAQTAWSPWFGRWMLNGDMLWVPFGEFVRRGPGAWQRLFRGDEVFIRPDSGQKTFVGQVLSLADFEHEVRVLDATSGVTPSTLVGVCSPKRIDAGMEWRFWLGEDGILASSPYSWDYVTLAAAPAEVVGLAEEIAQWCRDEANWKPDRLFVADLCLSNGRPRLIEINSASCSGVYQADLQQIFEGISRCAGRELDLA